NKAFDKNLNAFGDVNMIDTVIRNILNNALKFTEDGGKVTVNANDTEEKIAVSIADTGIGMTPEQRDNLFDITAKSSKGTNGESGTGLGLVIGKEFIQKNKGEIWVTENQPNGIVFHFTIPKANQ
ncbi:MAG TPA: ATP-binding protein, partial [Prolixibacteraceae bacterium]|nr:ATP-binding protein [Prolixibacteraceae bacterium]